jgi:DNA primase
LWVSNCFKDDDRLVITESAIDALSFHALKGDEKTRYVSTAGEWNPHVSSLLNHAANTLPGNRIVLAFDNDDAGKEYERRTRDALKDLPKEIHVLFPTAQGKDWNDVLRSRVLSEVSQKSL